ncbi:hypothetical protein DL96DRAFT_1975 [Flagelloscypha sp. PMI_526]|nr:hypothetical protein DL96DRAFT_1975 [Flagelloscypha sp. PMI_526]
MSSQQEAGGSPDSPTSRPEPQFKPGPKRPKSSQACLSCRKQKTRCEMINEDEKFLGKCHRCLTLNQPCSLEATAASKGSGANTGGLPAKNVDKLVSHLMASPRESQGVSHLGPSLGDDGGPKKLPHLRRSMWSWVSTDVNSLDWSSPTASLLEVSNRLYPPSATHISPIIHSSLAAIIEPSQIEYLLASFERNYDPWLCFTSIKGESTPVLDLVRCAVASRHLDLGLRQAIALPLNQLAENKIAALLLTPPKPTLELVQALLIWSIWRPVYEAPQGGLRDGRTIISAAIAMALSLRLNQVSTWLCSQSQNPMDSAIPSSTLAAQAQVWLSICNAESMMCLGTGRIPMARRSEADRTIYRNSRATSLVGGRETRLHLLGSLYDLAERGTCITFSGDKGSEQWYKNLKDVLDTMESLQIAISPLAAATDHEHHCFQAMNLHYDVCRLNVLYHNIYGVRYALRHLPVGFAWIKSVRPHGQEVLPDLARLVHRCAQSVVENLVLTDLEYLSPMPDMHFTHYTVCAASLIGIKFLIKRNRNIVIPGMTDQLLAKAADKLGKCAMTPDHSAHKAAELTRSMLSLWTRFSTLPSGGHLADQDYEGPSLLQEGRSPSTPLSGYASSSPHSHGLGVPQSGSYPPIDLNEPSMFVSAGQPPQDYPSSGVYPNSSDPSYQFFNEFLGQAGQTNVGQGGAESSDAQFWQAFLGNQGVADTMAGWDATPPLEVPRETYGEGVYYPPPNSESPPTAQQVPTAYLPLAGRPDFE